MIAVKTVQIVDSSIVNPDDEGSSSDVEDAQEVSQQPESIAASRSKRKIRKPASEIEGWGMAMALLLWASEF
ncbi:hypothetical protein F0562_017799 [Nyssa sinensis]|uniref:Uncharacterized protein n=1 Tax=Nyssa sinensis TaxID=561372 RepID=A0A5J4ZK23_9ASTE|nr:hypothetical protein F0562_017799 [Nyssa sinensis]